MDRHDVCSMRIKQLEDQLAERDEFIADLEIDLALRDEVLASLKIELEQMRYDRTFVA